MENKLISICIPSYNGSKTISLTLDSIISNIKDYNLSGKVDVVISDDCSTDDTISIIEKYLHSGLIKVCRNSVNLGMDKNFKKVAIDADAEYVWYSGQDDIFLDGSVFRAVEALEKNKDIDIINVNYSQYSEDKKKYVCESMFDLQSFFPEKIDYKENLLFNGAKEYFSFFNDVPSFLPSIIMRRNFWINVDSYPYIGTYFIQYATILLNLNKAKILGITRPLVKGLIPLNGWQTNGEKLFSIQLGLVKAREMVFLDERNPFPKRIHYRNKRFYFRRFLRITIASRNYNFSFSKKNREDLKMIYGKFLCYSYFFPIVFVIERIPYFFIRFLFNMKQKLDK